MPGAGEYENQEEVSNRHQKNASSLRKGDHFIVVIEIERVRQTLHTGKSAEC